MSRKVENSPSPSQIEFEDTRVRMVVEAFKLFKHLVPLLGDCESREGERRLTFESFRKFFPTFPIVLEARYAGRVAERCSPVDLFRRFDKLFVMDYFLEAYSRHQEEAQSRPVGLVLPFDTYRGGVVVHNGDFDTRAAKLTHAVANDEPPHRVTVEPFQSLIRHLARGPWTPESSLPEPGKAQGPQVCGEMSYTRWIVETVGDGPPLIVLSWMRKVMRSESAYDRCFVRRVGEAERCLMASLEQIADETGLSTRRIQRGLAVLQEMGLVELRGKTMRKGLLLSSSALAGSADH